jgi:hypothetical protein
MKFFLAEEKLNLLITVSLTFLGLKPLLGFCMRYEYLNMGRLLISDRSHSRIGYKNNDES